jgi:hypothetical protein
VKLLVERWSEEALLLLNHRVKLKKRRKLSLRQHRKVVHRLLNPLLLVKKRKPQLLVQPLLYPLVKNL